MWRSSAEHVVEEDPHRLDPGLALAHRVLGISHGGGNLDDPKPAQPGNDAAAVNANVAPHAADILTPPPHKTGRKAALDEQREVAGLLALMPTHPEAAAQLELHVATRDLAGTKRTLDSLAAPAAAVKPGEPNSEKAIERHGNAEKYFWRVTASQIKQLSQKVQAAPTSIEIQWRHRPGAQPFHLDVTAGGPAWPSLVPDYTAILQQQVPQTKPDAVAAVVEIPVWIEVITAPAPSPSNSGVPAASPAR